jgi:predicted porin
MAASGAAFAATSNVEVYGLMNVAVQDTDVGTVDPTVVDNFSRIGFKGSEDLGGGLTAIWQIEQQLNFTQRDSLSEADIGADLNDDSDESDFIGVSSNTLRNTFVGVKGAFGTVLAGRHDTPYKLGSGKFDIFGDTIADYNAARLDSVSLISNTHDHRNPQALAYISPEWNGFHFAVAAVMADGVNNLVTADKAADATSYTAIYTNGPLFVSYSGQKANDVNYAASGDGGKAQKVAVGYTLAGVNLGLVYEEVKNTSKAYVASATHAMGPINLKAQYGEVEFDAAGTTDDKMWAVGMDYNLSKRTAAYVVYGNGDNGTGDDVTGWTLGMKHSF